MLSSHKNIVRQLKSGQSIRNTATLTGKARHAILAEQGQNDWPEKDENKITENYKAWIEQPPQGCRCAPSRRGREPPISTLRLWPYPPRSGSHY